MCGILGRFPALDDQPLRRVLTLLEHRGPDGTNTWHHPEAILSLGHTRLSIIDLSHDADQPFMYADRYYIVYNGELYNYLEVKDELEKLGHRFKTTSDTEVVIAAYAQWGAACLRKFNGMWAIAIWDEQEQELFLSRDRYGEKPLFYTQQGGRFTFASEMKALLPLMDRVAVAENFQWLVSHTLDYEATEHCLIEDIKRFPAGHYGVYKNGEVKLTRYWNTLDEIRPLAGNYNDHVAEFSEILADSVRLRLRSDVKLGVSLSGGLDSSTVLYKVMEQISAENGVQKPGVFTAIFPGTKLDEQQYADQLADEYSLKKHHVNVDAKKALTDLEDDIFYLEEIYRNAPSPMMQLYNSFRKNDTYVSLDGHGPDELFSGYDNFIFLALLDAGFDAKKWEEIFDIYRGMYPEKNGQHATRKLGWMSVMKTWAWYQKTKGKFNTDQAKNDWIVYRNLLSKMGYLNEGLYRIFHYGSFPTLLRNYDRFAMRSGVEVRMPFTDHRLVNFCFSLPWQEKLGGGYTKRIMRDSLKNGLQENFAKRSYKIGFQSPLKDWLKKDWKDAFEGLQHDKTFLESDLVDATKTTKLWQNFLSKPDATLEDANKIWLQLAPYFWEQYFLKSEKWRVLK